MLANGWRNAAWAAILCLGAGAVRAEDAKCCATQKAACPCQAVKACVKQCVRSLPGLSCCCGSLMAWLSTPYCPAAKCLKGCVGVCVKGKVGGCCVSAGVGSCGSAGCTVAPSMPDPMPIATGYGLPTAATPVPPLMPVCPTPVWSGPMPMPCVTAGPAAPPGKEYALDVKIVEIRPGAKDKVTDCPRVVLYEGKCASVSFTDRLLLDECRPACASRACGGVLEAAVTGTGEGKMRLELGVEEMRAKQGRQGVVELGMVLHANLDMTAGEPARIIVDLTPEGKPRRWLEAKVTVAPAAPEHRAASSHDVQEQIAALWDAVGDLAEMAERLVAERIAAGTPQPSGGMRLPPQTYFFHPPQYIPPTPPVGPEPLPPPAMVVRPDVVFQPAAMPVPGPWLMPPPAPPMPPPPAVMAMTPTVVSSAKEKGWVEIGAGAHNSEARVTLHIAGEGGPLHIATAGKQVRVKGPLLQATADKVRVTPEGLVILEGHFDVRWAKDNQVELCGGDGRVTVHPGKGNMKCEPCETK